MEKNRGQCEADDSAHRPKRIPPPGLDASPPPGMAREAP